MELRLRIADDIAERIGPSGTGELWVHALVAEDFERDREALSSFGV
jgi:hypothetical protein